jgi:hypothetical protein
MIPVKTRIHGKVVYFKSKNEFAKYLITTVSDKYSPLQTRVQNLMKIMDLTDFPKKAKYLGKIKTEEVFTKAYWETILSLENMGTLTGFLVDAPIEKGSSNYNPERKRISTDWVFAEKNK